MKKPTRDPHPSRRAAVWGCVVLVVVGSSVYSNSLQNEFVYDDPYSITENPHIRQLWPPSKALTGPPGSASNGRPVVAFTLAVNYALGGLDVVGYHVFNVCIHVLTALMLFALGRAVLAAPRAPHALAPHATAVGFAIALVWMVHPLHTAALNHVVYRNEILASSFYLMTLYAVVRAASDARARSWPAIAVAACFVAVGSKEIAVTCPVVALLLDRAFFSGSFRAAWQARGRLYLALASSWIPLGYLVASADRGGSVGLHVEGVTPLDYARTQIGVVVHYIRLALWPQPLVLDYQWSIARSFGSVAPQALILAALLATTLWGLVRKPQWGVWGAWFFVILSPTSSFVPLTGAIAAEHRMYLPLVALIFLAVGGGAAALLSRPPQQRNAGVLVALVVVALASILASRTVARNRDYRTEQTIWTDTLAKRPNNWRAHNSLAGTLTEESRWAEAIEHYEAAIRLNPKAVEAHNSLGSVWLRVGQPERARARFREALRVDANNASAHSNMAGLLVRLQELDAARRHVDEALRINPEYGMAYYNLAAVFMARGQLDSALVNYREASARLPHFAEAHNGLATAYLQRHDYASALRHYRATLEIDPDHAGALNNMAWLLATCPSPRLRDASAALSYAERALRAAGGPSGGGLDTQAAAWAEAGRFDDAIRTAERALQMARDSGDDALARRIEARLQLYRNRQAYRMAAP